MAARDLPEAAEATGACGGGGGGEGGSWRQAGRGRTRVRPAAEGGRGTKGYKRPELFYLDP